VRSKFLSKRRRPLHEDEDPITSVANLFDVAMVFAVALLLAMVAYSNLPEILSNKDVTIVKNPGAPDMEIIVKKGTEIKRYNISEEIAGGEGTKLGSAYRLKTGEIVYVPDINETM
jgi:hypothetical protein